MMRRYKEITKKGGDTLKRVINPSMIIYGEHYLRYIIHLLRVIIPSTMIYGKIGSVSICHN